MNKKIFLNKLKESIASMQSLEKQTLQINKCISLLYKTLKNKNKILICGNGGSASQAEHFSTEFLVRLNKNINRRPLAIVPLAFNNSHLTACSNDYSFNQIFSKTLEAVGKKNDCIITLSTSGKSKNVLNALKISRKMKISSIGFFGASKIEKADINLYVGSKDTARIQEAHLFLGHFILNEVEKKLFKKNKK